MNMKFDYASGDIVGDRYRVDKPIGIGGYATVYRAEQLDTGRWVALKVMHTQLQPSDSEVKRFAREAELAAKIDHPCVVRQYDHGQTPSGLPFIAFELLTGSSLKLRLKKEGALSVRRTGRIALQVLQALEAAHALSVVHRDIKPANLFLCSGAEDDVVKVLDFGIAKALAGDGPEQAKLTATGQVVGTPAYMAPEQLKRQQVRANVDLYALGLVMAEMLAGKRVLTANNDIDMFMEHISPTPFVLSEAVTDSPLGPVVARAIEKSSDRRYATATDMRVALTDALARHGLLDTTAAAAGPDAVEAPPSLGPESLSQARTTVRDRPLPRSRREEPAPASLPTKPATRSAIERSSEAPATPPSARQPPLRAAAPRPSNSSAAPPRPKATAPAAAPPPAAPSDAGGSGTQVIPPLGEAASPAPAPAPSVDASPPNASDASASAATAAPGPPEVDPYTFRPGSVFNGGYEIVRRLGAGGMGAVYEVVQQSTRRSRALKVMLPAVVADPRMRERFKLEATVAAGIDSDHIVEPLDAGVDDTTGIPFIVMELLKGQELAGMLDAKGRLAAQDVVTILYQAAMALERTHAAGIIHRDLKPENLFITLRDDGSLRLKVLDFGVAKIVARNSSSGSLGTRSVGSPLYMAPEQIRGNKHIGPETDRYALAHVAFTLLVGQAYWSPEQQEAEGIYPFLMQIVDGMKEPATARAAALGVQLPAGFDAWFDKAAAVPFAERFDSTYGMVAALAAVLGVSLPERGPALVDGDSLEPSGPSRRLPAFDGDTHAAMARAAHDEPPPRSGLRRWALAGGGALAAAGIAVGLWFSAPTEAGAPAGAPPEPVAAAPAPAVPLTSAPSSTATATVESTSASAAPSATAPPEVQAPPRPPAGVLAPPTTAPPPPPPPPPVVDPLNEY